MTVVILLLGLGLAVLSWVLLIGRDWFHRAQWERSAVSDPVWDAEARRLLAPLFDDEDRPS
jgi:hypothetical protein